MSVEETVVESEVNEMLETEEEIEEVEEETEEISEDEETEEVETEEEETVITFGDEVAPASEDHSAPEWVKEVRKANRELQKKNRELEQKLQSSTVAVKAPIQLRVKPKLEDYDYDSDQYEASLDNWHEEKRGYDEQQRQAKAEQDNQAKAWGNTLESYATKKSALNVPDYDDAEHVILETLSETQQSMILQGADNPALLVYALGKNPKRAKELADIKDPVKFAFAVAKLETTVKTTSRKKAPPAEKTVSGNGKVSVNDSTLDKLRAEAEKTGNYSKVTAYKAKMKK